MTSGIVIFGKDLNLDGFYAIRKSKHLLSKFLFYKPVESAYSFCLDNPEKYGLTEGILACVSDLNNERVDFKVSFKSYLIYLAKQFEKDYCNSHQNGREWAVKNGVDYDFPVSYQQIARTDITKDGRSDLVWEPFCEFLNSGSMEEVYRIYEKVASNLVKRTRDARIERAKKREYCRAENFFGMIHDKNESAILM